MTPQIRHNKQKSNKRNVACPYCRYTRYVQYRPRNYAAPFRCSNCGTVFTREVADAEEAVLKQAGIF